MKARLVVAGAITCVVLGAATHGPFLPRAEASSAAQVALHNHGTFQLTRHARSLFDGRHHYTEKSEECVELHTVHGGRPFAKWDDYVPAGRYVKVCPAAAYYRVSVHHLIGGSR